jgi:hypothetical protein
MHLNNMTTIIKKLSFLFLLFFKVTKIIQDVMERMYPTAWEYTRDKQKGKEKIHKKVHLSILSFKI